VANPRFRKTLKTQGIDTVTDSVREMYVARYKTNLSGYLQVNGEVGVMLITKVNFAKLGTWAAPGSVDPVNLTRSSSTTVSLTTHSSPAVELKPFQGYYLPNSGRKNLTVIVGAYVNHLQLQDGKGNDPIVATGVEFRHGEKTYRAQVKREVVLCAGCVLRLRLFRKMLLRAAELSLGQVAQVSAGPGAQRDRRCGGAGAAWH
jgi:hypothetical protein